MIHEPNLDPKSSRMEGSGGPKWSPLPEAGDLRLDTCWYCGSWSPEALLRILKERLWVGKDGGVGRLGGSDWKYRWPHKFYVDVWTGVPAKPLLTIYLREGETPPEGAELLTEAHGIAYLRHGGRHGNIYVVADTAVHKAWDGSKGFAHWPGTGWAYGKFYNEHLLDLAGSPDVFAELAQLVTDHFGIQFSIVDVPTGSRYVTADGRSVDLHYSAPHAGYQR